MSGFSQINDYIRSISQEDEMCEYLAFEPWDIGERPAWFYDECRRDGIDIDDDVITQIVGKPPRDFQSSVLLSTSHFDITIGASQIGKSYPDAIDTIAMLTGEVPYSLRYPKGVDTGIKRPITPLNVMRWGRRDALSGELIDYDHTAVPDPSEWDCGNIIGCGIYPASRFCTAPSPVVWIGTMREPAKQMWIPTLRRLIPKRFLDMKRGVNGYSDKDNTFYLTTGRICIITYEQKYNRFEAKKAWKITLDEEPSDRRIFAAAMTHFEFCLRMVYTPYNGITWSYDDVIRRALNDKSVLVRHATQYDCPYDTREKINSRKAKLKRWEIAARVYGLYSDQSGSPYFDREKVMVWINTEIRSYQYAEFVPSTSFNGVKELPSVQVLKNDVDESDGVSTWEVYEDYRPECGYWITADTSLGGSSESDTGDHSSACIFRTPLPGEDEPKLVAFIFSRAKPQQFGMICLYAAAYYGNALFAPETRGESGATVLAATQDWPRYYRMTVIRDADKRPVKRLGFDTNTRTRPIIFSLVDNYIRTHESSGLKSLRILKEMAECVRDENGRPDHPHGGSTDALVSFGIGLYIWEYDRNQIPIGKAPERKSRFFDNDTGVETRPVLGSRRGLDERERQKIGHPYQGYVRRILQGRRAALEAVSQDSGGL